MRTLTLDIVDYPGEWLLDLPLLDKSYAQWSAETLAARRPTRPPLAAPLARPSRDARPGRSRRRERGAEAARLFTDYLRACRAEHQRARMLPPGRFLMPGDLAGSPALTFAPLEAAGEAAAAGSIWAMMERRYEAYRDACGAAVLPRAFRPARPPDRAGRRARRAQCRPRRRAAICEAALTAMLASFRAGRGRWSARCFARASTASCSPPPRRITCTMPTMTGWKRSSPHDRARDRARRSLPAPQVDVIALAAVRATREATVTREGRERCRHHRHAAHRRGATAAFDGDSEMAIFPGDLPAGRASAGAISASSASARRRGATDAGLAGLAPHPPRPRVAIPHRGPAA